MKNLNFLKKGLIAHRGIHNEKIPENSLKAFSLAVKNDLIIELDIHLTKDNKIVVFHDNNLKRMTNFNKEIKDCNYSEIKDLNLKNTKEKIPTLEEVLNIIDGKVPVIIEIKYCKKIGAIEKVLVSYLDNYNGLFAVKSFNPLSIYWFKKNRPDYIRGLLVSNKYKNFKEFILYKMYFLNIVDPDFISCNYNLVNNKKIEKFKNKKLVMAWTINSKKNYDLYKNKFDNLICNNVEGINGKIKW